MVRAHSVLQQDKQDHWFEAIVRTLAAVASRVDSEDLTPVLDEMEIEVWRDSEDRLNIKISIPVAEDGGDN
jgi:hypothetical protein